MISDKGTRVLVDCGISEESIGIGIGVGVGVGIGVCLARVLVLDQTAAVGYVLLTCWASVRVGQSGHVLVLDQAAAIGYILLTHRASVRHDAWFVVGRFCFGL